MIGCLGTPVRKQPIIALYFASEAMFLCLLQLNSSGNTSLSLQSGQTLVGEELDDDEGLTIPEREWCMWLRFISSPY